MNLVYKWELGLREGRCGSKAKVGKLPLLQLESSPTGDATVNNGDRKITAVDTTRT